MQNKKTIGFLIKIGIVFFALYFLYRQFITKSRTDDFDLDDIPDCDLTPTYDLAITLHQSLIDVITDHFSSDGPFWINGYRLSDDQVITQTQAITQPFSLANLIGALINLGWISELPVNVIDDETDQVELTLNGSTSLIMSICINLLNND